ncbi:MAG: O-antigen ligase family protein [Acetivibrionales bacterium]|jgi:O-antigen ligase
MNKSIVDLAGKASKALLILTIFFLWVEMVTPPLVLGMKINFMLLKISLVFFVFHILISKQKMKVAIKPLNKWLVIMLSLYFLLDLLGIIYSEIPVFSIERYKGHIAAAVLSALIIMQFDSKREIYGVFIVLGCASTTISILSAWAFFSGSMENFVYSSRVSLFTDYNTFGTQIIIGTGILLSVLINSSLSRVLSVPLAVMAAVFNATIVLLSGSRRSVLLLVVVSFIITFHYITALFRKKRLVQAVAGLVVFCALAFFVFTMVMQEFKTLDLYNGLSLTKRYDTLYSIEGYNSRLARWALAFEEFNRYNLPGILFGKGTGYDSYYYSRVFTAELNSEYPHNMFLSDLLNGGLVKMVAWLSSVRWQGYVG